MPLSEKEGKLRNLGVDTFYVVEFNKEFASLQPEEFVSHYLIGDDQDPADLFDRTFNGRWADIETTVVSRLEVRPQGTPPRPSTHLHGGPARAGPHRVPPSGGARRWCCPRPTSPRSCSSSGRHYDALEETGPFDGDEFGLQALSLLHRVARLTGALEPCPRRVVRRAGRPERRPVDPRTQHLRHAHRHLATGVGLLPDPRGRIGRRRAVAVQTLISVVRWMQANDLDGAELNDDPRRDTRAGRRRRPSAGRRGRRARRAVPAVPARPARTTGLRLASLRRAVRAGRPRGADRRPIARSPCATGVWCASTTPADAASAAYACLLVSR